VTAVPALGRAPVPAAAADSQQHDWMLVAPWWHWPAQTGHGRTSRPALQKYETSDLVNTFLADPQLRLQFLPGTDEIVRITPASSPLGRPARTATGVRKLYLDTHRRHYLVTCELHCDATGFPAVTRDQVCQAGFVIRRRLYDVPDAERTAARMMLRRLTGARQRLASVETELAAARSRPGGTVHRGQLEARRDVAGNLVAQHEATLREWAAGIGLRRQLEGWLPQGKDAAGGYVDLPACPVAGTTRLAPLAGVGRWATVEELPDELAEGWFPLLPLIASPAQPDSDAAGATIFFGLVPTGSADVDPSGTARFDEASGYEIRCFVRRHKPACPRTGPQCHCPVVWSDPTESYMLAPHFDLQGTANRPVTVQLPDLNALQSDALTLPPGSTGGIIMKAPQSLMPTATFPPGGAQGPAENCTFAIPLISIVATFVFKLFLPVVILAFQLWFLLALKFCLPPEAALDAGLEAALQDLPPDLSVPPTFEAQFGATLDSEIDDLMGQADLGNGKASQVLGNTNPKERIRLAKQLLSGPVSASPPTDLIFAPHVDRSMVVP
jgi:hypothetical protein